MSSIEYTPTAEEVAAYIPARTKSSWGNKGKFLDGSKELNEEWTFPSKTQVETLIGQATAYIAPRVGTINDPCKHLIGNVRGLIALRAAMLVELTHFAEQINTNQSPYPQLKELYDEARVEVIDAVEDCRADDDPDDGSNIGPGGSPRGRFDLCPDMIGLQTEF